MRSLRELFEKAGGMEASAKACGVSVRALYKWASRGSLPRTEYTGETQYAEKLASLCGKSASAEEIKDRFQPKTIAV